MIAGYEPDFWHWWILGLALIIAETVLPGTYFLWMGVSAVALGVIALGVLLAVGSTLWVLGGVIWSRRSVLTT